MKGAPNEYKGRSAASDEIAAANAHPAILTYIEELESGIRETIPLLERNGRAMLATKLRKLIGG